MKNKFKVSKTNRGFTKINFNDRYNKPSYLQDSSIATEACIWFGVENPDPVIMAVDAAKLGVETKEKLGWISYPIPKEVLITTQMHLSLKQVKKLIPILQHFVDTGYLPEKV